MGHAAGGRGGRPAGRAGVRILMQLHDGAEPLHGMGQSAFTTDLRQLLFDTGIHSAARMAQVAVAAAN
jgi:hypothetical protein